MCYILSKVLVTESYLTDIGNAIRTKNNSTMKYKPSEMAKAIDSIVLGDPAVIVNSDSAWKYTVTQKEHENVVVNVSDSLIGDNTSGYQTKIIFTPAVSSDYGYNAGTIRKTADEKNHIANFTVDDAIKIDGLFKDGWAGIYAHAVDAEQASEYYSVDYYFNDYNNYSSSKVDNGSKIENLLILGYYRENSNGNLIANTKNNFANYNPSASATLKKYQDKYATAVAPGGFDGCSALTTIDIPNATSIGDYAFDGCSALTTIDIPNATSIGDYAFNGCSALTTIDIPNATSIGHYAFDGLKLKTIYLRSKTMCTCTGTPFSSISLFFIPTIYVPTSLIDSYKTANYWKNYASKFKTLESIQLSKISIIGSNKINMYGGNTTGTYKIKYNDGAVLPEQTGVTWSITGNATISQDGVVTLNDSAKSGDTLTITATSTYNSSISASLTVSVISVATSMTVDLNNGQWVDSGTAVDGHTVYKSDAGSYNINNGTSTCTITFFGYSKVTVYTRSYAEGDYDYTEVGPLDGTVSRDNSSNVLSTKGKQSASEYQSYTFNISDNNSQHTFQVLYSKDSSSNSNDDRGYFYVVCE